MFKNLFNFKSYLIQNRIIDQDNSKDILEHRLLPIWSKKQKEIEEYIYKVEVIKYLNNFEF